MRIAIILGVGVQSIRNKLGTLVYRNLPECKNDALLISNIISAIPHYEEKDILYINDTGSTTVKYVLDEVDSFLSKYTNENVEELFFYFSGHGDYKDGQFYFVLYDNLVNSSNGLSAVSIPLAD